MYYILFCFPFLSKIATSFRKVTRYNKKEPRKFRVLFLFHIYLMPIDVVPKITFAVSSEISIGPPMT